MTTYIRRTLCILFLTCSALAAEDGKYTNDFHGISFRPPAGSQHIPRMGRGPLAQWVQTQQRQQTTQLLWSLSLQQNFSKIPKQTLVQLAQSLETKIRKLPGGKVTDKTVVQAGPYKVLMLEGLTTPRAGTATKPAESIHFRQAWIKTQPGTYLTLKLDSIDGQSIATLWNNLWVSLRMVDPTPFRKTLELQASNAAKFLAATSSNTTHAVLDSGPQWFLLEENGRATGWRCLHSKACLRTITGRIVSPDSVAGTQKGSQKGFRVRIWSYFLPAGKPKNQATLAREIIFLADDNQLESWRTVKQKGLDQTAANATSSVIAFDGLRQNNSIVNIVTQGTSVDTQQHRLTAKVGVCYLPKALNTLLPKLLNRTQPQAYTFTCYDHINDLLTARTVRVVGPGTVTVGSIRMRAVKLTDQLDIGLSPRSVWVDPTTGKTLRIDDGTQTSIASDQAQILAQFSDALGVIKSLNDAEARSRKVTTSDDLRPSATQPGQPIRLPGRQPR